MFATVGSHEFANRARAGALAFSAVLGALTLLVGCQTYSRSVKSGGFAAGEAAQIP